MDITTVLRLPREKGVRFGGNKNNRGRGLLRKMADGSESSNEAKKVSPILASQFQLALLQLVEKANLQKQTTIAFPLASTSTGSAEEYRNHDVAAKIISLFPRPVKPPPVAKIPSKKKLQKKVPADDIVKKPAICTIPYNRVRMLMKTAPNITNVSLEAITLTAKAAVRPIYIYSVYYYKML